MDLTDKYRVFHLAAAQYTFFSVAHGTFSKIDHILGHKARLNTYKKTEITPCILSDHNGIKLEINNKRNYKKIFKHMETDKGLITRIYRELKKLNTPKINEPIKKWATELNRSFSKEEIQMAKKHMKKCSPSLAIKEMQIKTTLRFYLTPVRIAIIKNTTNNRCW
jgi:hypothetical protein